MNLTSRSYGAVRTKFQHINWDFMNLQPKILSHNSFWLVSSRAFSALLATSWAQLSSRYQDLFVKSFFIKFCGFSRAKVSTNKVSDWWLEVEIDWRFLPDTLWKPSIVPSQANYYIDKFVQVLIIHLTKQDSKILSFDLTEQSSKRPLLSNATLHSLLLRTVWWHRPTVQSFINLLHWSPQNSLNIYHST